MILSQQVLMHIKRQRQRQGLIVKSLLQFHIQVIYILNILKILTQGSNSDSYVCPKLDGSGVPNTIFKGSARDYTKKECVLIFNRETNEIILEKLCGNIQVKKTRTDSSNKQPQPQPPPPAIITSKVENQTARQSSKTRVSTGTTRKNVLHFVPKHSPHQQQQQGSPSYHPHRSPQQQPP